jgi:hypothetical protein
LKKQNKNQKTQLSTVLSHIKLEFRHPTVYFDYTEESINEGVTYSRVLPCSVSILFPALTLLS